MILVFAKNRLYGAARGARRRGARSLSSVTLATVLVLGVVLRGRVALRHLLHLLLVLVPRRRAACRAAGELRQRHGAGARRAALRAAGAAGGGADLVATIAESLERAESRHGRALPGRRPPAAHPGRGPRRAPAGRAARAARGRSTRTPVDEVILAGWAGDDAPVVELLDLCRRRGLPVRLAPTTAELLSHSVQAVPAPGLPLFDLRPPVLGGAAFLAKRAFDLVMGSLLGILAAPGPGRRGDRHQARGPRAGDPPPPAGGRGGDASSPASSCARCASGAEDEQERAGGGQRGRRRRSSRSARTRA